MRVAACLVTRGNVPMDDIIDSIPEDWEVVVWDNSKREDLAVYGRFAAITLTDAEMIYVQDDDCVLELGRHLLRCCGFRQINLNLRLVLFKRRRNDKENQKNDQNID